MQEKINHLAFIVDGNGRWAEERGLSRSDGHTKGAKTLEKLVLYIARNDLANYISLYIFSTENFNRPKEEVNHLMYLFIKYFNKCKEKYSKENIKIIFSGETNILSKDIQESIITIEEYTKDNTGLVVNLCLSYGGRREITYAIKNICRDVLDHKLTIDDIDESIIPEYLYHNLPDIDFVIRTSGEMRISNFMLWQISYAELYFPSILFPDFTIKDLKKAYQEYDKRNRRFGSIK